MRSTSKSLDLNSKPKRKYKKKSPTRSTSKSPRRKSRSKSPVVKPKRNYKKKSKSPTRSTSKSPRRVSKKIKSPSDSELKDFLENPHRFSILDNPKDLKDFLKSK